VESMMMNGLETTDGHADSQEAHGANENTDQKAADVSHRSSDQSRFTWSC
jgi:hypothetical protein